MDSMNSLGGAMRVCCISLALLLFSRGVVAEQPSEIGTVYIVPVSHLDTEWLWTIADTITTYLEPTFRGNMELLDRYPDFRFGFEGAYRYMLLREYFPDLYGKLKAYIAAGRFRPQGSSIEANDVHIPSAEGLIRQFLYGTRFFRSEFGVSGADVFLPDCFGFGFVLPTVAAHCGLKGFSTQKLSPIWGPAIPPPFDVGIWEGPDGSGIIAALKCGNYAEEAPQDPANHPPWIKTLGDLAAGGIPPVIYRYFGVGDRGGPVQEGSVQRVVKAANEGGQIKVIPATSDSMFDDLTPDQVAALPRYSGELLLTSHGTGTYTSQAAMKRWNRQNEALAHAAERLSAIAWTLGLIEYPSEALYRAWLKYLSQHFHDNITGTSIPQVYEDAWNDEGIAMNIFADVIGHAAGALARLVDTATGVEGVPLLVIDPVPGNGRREEAVDVIVRYAGTPPEYVRVFRVNGQEVASQVIERGTDWLRVVFHVSMDGTALAVYDIRPSQAPSQVHSAIKISNSSIENGKLAVYVDENGDIAQVRDLVRGRDLLSRPATLDLFLNLGLLYPAWEISYGAIYDFWQGPVRGPVEVRVLESGPARGALEVKRQAGSSVYIQTIRLAKDSDLMEVELRIDWHEKASLLKASFPLTSAAPKATYDLGIGVIERGNANPSLYEVPSRLFVDLSTPANGVTIVNDCKYGWDKPDDSTLRMTLIHTPMMPEAHHDTNDFGVHRLRYGIWPHDGNWSSGAPSVAAKFNHPLLVFQVPKRNAKSIPISLVTPSSEAVGIMAVKKAEDRDEIVVRVNERYGKFHEDVFLDFGMPVVYAHELNGIEDEIGPATYADKRLHFALKPFQPRTFGVKLTPPKTGLTPPSSRRVLFQYDSDVVTVHGGLFDGAFDAAQGRSYCGEQWPESMKSGGATFWLGGASHSKLNALTCRGQTIPISPKPGERLYLLASALADRTAILKIGETKQEFTVQDWTSVIRRWYSRITNGVLISDGSILAPPITKLAPIAAFQTHRHSTGGDEVYKHTYLFRYAFDIPEGATEVVLPDDEAVRIFAISLVDDPGDRALAVSELYDDYDPRLVQAPAELLGPGSPIAQPDIEGDTASPDAIQPFETTEITNQETSGYHEAEPCPVCSGGCAAYPTSGSAALIVIAVAVMCLRAVQRRPSRISPYRAVKNSRK